MPIRLSLSALLTSMEGTDMIEVRSVNTVRKVQPDLDMAYRLGLAQAGLSHILIALEVVLEVRKDEMSDGLRKSLTRDLERGRKRLAEIERSLPIG